jgi:hypothetical protein
VEKSWGGEKIAHVSYGDNAPLCAVVCHLLVAGKTWKAFEENLPYAG